jgi:AcrR family transcriptional regulator
MSEYSLIKGVIVKKKATPDLDLSELNLPEKEEKILKSAIKLFSEKGFEASTSKEIAEDAGVAEGTIFKYFKTKKDIITSILVHLLNLTRGKFVLKGIKEIFEENKSDDIKIILKKIIYERFKLVDKFFPMAQIIFIQAIFHEEVREAIFNNIIKNALKMFDEFYKELTKKGILRNDIDSMIIFRSIVGNVVLFIAQRKIFNNHLKLNDIDKEIDIVIDIILNGIIMKNN